MILLVALQNKIAKMTFVFFKSLNSRGVGGDVVNPQDRNHRLARDNRRHSFLKSNQIVKRGLY